MPLPERRTYLTPVIAELKKQWPGNRAVNVVCHGHSVPSGYFATPFVDTFNAYPHLLHAALKHRFPYAVANVIVTAIGGENSESGAKRFEAEVLCHRPDVVTIDYALNDRKLGLDGARRAWTAMIESALARGVKVLLLTPTADMTQRPDAPDTERRPLQDHAAQVRALAAQYGVGLADSLTAFEAHMKTGDLTDLMSWTNHPNRAGHEIVARELMRWFSY